MTLVEVRGGAVRMAIELLCESSLSGERTGGVEIGEVQIEEVSRQRVALIVDGVGPGVRSLEHPEGGTITRYRGQRVVIRCSLARAPLDCILQIGIVRMKRAIHDIGGQKAAAKCAQGIQLHVPAIGNALLQSQKVTLGIAAA